MKSIYNIYGLSSRIIRFLVISFTLLLSALKGNSQTDSLLFYLTLAAENNPVVQQNFYEYQAALQKVVQASALPDPQAELGILLTPMELVMGKQLAEFKLMQMFPWFGTLRAAKNEMSLMANARYETLRDSKWQLFFEVQKTWYDLYRIRKAIEISERNLEILRTIERLSTRRYKTAPTGRTSGSVAKSSTAMPATQSSNSQGNSNMQGMENSGYGNISSSGIQSTQVMADNSMAAGENTGLIDLYRIQIEIEDLRNKIALLGNQQMVILSRFNGYLNRPSQFSVVLPDTLNADTSVVILSLNSYDTVITRNPMIKMLQSEKQSLEARKKMINRMGYPMIGLGVNYTIIGKTEMENNDMNGEDMIMPMMSITLPVYRKKYRSMKNEADYRASSSESRYQDALNNLRTEYYEAMQLFEDSKRRIALYSNQQSLATSSYSILMRDFSASSSALTDILRICQQILDYELKQTEAVTDFNTSIAWLKRLGFVFNE